MELTAILLRTVFMYLFVFLIIRLMGKREIGKLSVFDMVISIMLAEIAVISIESTERSLWVTIGPMAVLVVIQLAISHLTLRNRKLRLWFDGEPSVLIRGGRLNWREMRRQRYNLDDLMTQLRENRVTDIGDIELAVLEANGKLSVLPRENAGAESRPAAEAGTGAGAEAGAIGRAGSGAGADAKAPGHSATIGSDQAKLKFGLLPVALVMDGKVLDDGLEQIGRNRFWLLGELRERGIRSFDQVFYCSLDHRGRLYVDRKR